MAKIGSIQKNTKYLWYNIAYKPADCYGFAAQDLTNYMAVPLMLWFGHFAGCRTFPLERSDKKMNKSHKILLISLLYMGDFMFTTPFIRNLRKNNPHSQFDMIANADFYDLLAENPYLDNIYPYDRRAGLAYGIRFARKMRKEKYDLGITLGDSERSLLLLWSIKPKKAFYFHKFFKKNKCQDRHLATSYLDFLPTLGFRKVDDEGLQLVITPAEIPLLSNIGKGKNIVGINPGGSWPTKQWTAAGFARLADALQRDGQEVILLGGPMDTEKTGKIIDLMETKLPIVLTGKMNLKQLVTAINKCDLVISGDTGPVHVAAALRIPTVAIFGPSDPIRFHPYGNLHRLVSLDLPCQPCGSQICDHNSCMKNLPAEKVLEAANYLLSQNNRAGNGIAANRLEKL